MPRPGEDAEQDGLAASPLVTTAITNAIDKTAPVFCTSTRAPEAMPRRCGATTPIIAAVLGELNMPEPTPDDEHGQRRGHQ